MGIIIRQSIISSILLYLGAIVGYINILYLFPKFLTAGEIGITRTIQDMAALLVPIAQFGLTQSMLKFFPKMGLNETTKSAFLTLMLLVGIISYSLFVVIFYFFSDLIASFFELNAAVINQYFPLVLAIVLLLMFYNILVAYTQSHLNIVAPNFIKDILFRLATACILIAYFLRWISFDQFLYALVASYGLMTISILVFLVIRNQVSISFKFSFLSKSFLSQMMYYAMFSVLGASGMLIIGKIDSLMVTSMLGVELNGLYTTVFYIAVVIELPKRAINQISLPLVSRSFEKNDLQGIQKLYSQSSINQLIIGCLLLIGIWINLDSIFSIMPNGDFFAAGKIVVIVIGLGRIFDMAAGINSEIIVMSRYYRFNMILLALLAVVTILLNLYLIPRYGITGAAIGSAAALVIFNISKFVFLKVAFDIQPFSVSTIKVILFSTITLLLCLYLPRLDNPMADLFYRSIIAVIIFCTGIYYLKPSEEVQAIFDKIRKIFL